jgi:argininosuccinate lyase
MTITSMIKIKMMMTDVMIMIAMCKSKDDDTDYIIIFDSQELVGSVGGKLHTGRSRNDQVCIQTNLQKTTFRYTKFYALFE